ncbi:NAD-dependent epimerase/dehydratase family protein [Spirosoma flavum]|uniref:NAD-dependent epimerase/dehydratase family protein n=1 Tax=Spirosoma flavum TaxID=2048557 RepID=A0ABW6AG14_9BACT
MNILLTGASGFLGSRIYRTLALEHTITTLGRTPIHSRHIRCNLAEQVPLLPNESYDIIVNVAGKAHSVPRTALERADYQRINVQGTVHFLTALEYLSILPKSLVHISTVLVYGCSMGELLPETTPLQATDAYGFSKIEAEMLMCEWAERKGIRLSILRLPLIVAEQPKGNLAAMLKAIRHGYYIRIGTGLARRSMVRADDVADVITRVAEVGGIYNLTDGCHPTICELENALARYTGRSRPIPSMPVPFTKALARVGDGINSLVCRRFPLDSIAFQKLTNTLTFSDDLARQKLEWNPRPVLDLF